MTRLRTITGSASFHRLLWREGREIWQNTSPDVPQQPEVTSPVERQQSGPTMITNEILSQAWDTALAQAEKATTRQNAAAKNAVTTLSQVSSEHFGGEVAAAVQAPEAGADGRQAEQRETSADPIAAFVETLPEQQRGAMEKALRSLEQSVANAVVPVLQAIEETAGRQQSFIQLSEKFAAANVNPYQMASIAWMAGSPERMESAKDQPQLQSAVAFIDDLPPFQRALLGLIGRNVEQQQPFPTESKGFPPQERQEIADRANEALRTAFEGIDPADITPEQKDMKIAQVMLSHGVSVVDKNGTLTAIPPTDKMEQGINKIAGFIQLLMALGRMMGLMKKEQKEAQEKKENIENLQKRAETLNTHPGNSNLKISVQPITYDNGQKGHYVSFQHRVNGQSLDKTVIDALKSTDARYDKDYSVATFEATDESMTKIERALLSLFEQNANAQTNDSEAAPAEKTTAEEEEAPTAPPAAEPVPAPEPTAAENQEAVTSQEQTPSKVDQLHGYAKTIIDFLKQQEKTHPGSGLPQKAIDAIRKESFDNIIAKSTPDTYQYAAGMRKAILEYNKAVGARKAANEEGGRLSKNYTIDDLNPEDFVVDAEV